MFSVHQSTPSSTVMGFTLILLAVLGLALVWTYDAGGIQELLSPGRTSTQVSAPAAAPPQQTVGSSGGVPAAAAPAGTQRFVIVPSQSAVVYRVDETLFNEGNRLNTAVGTTTAVRGEITVDRARPAHSRIGTIAIDISRFSSDSARRDSAIRERWLESARYPTAAFVATAIKGLPGTYQDGRDVAVQITGNLTVRGVTRPTTWAATINVDGNRLTVTGQTTVKMTDFGFAPPSLFFLKAEDGVRLEFRFVAVGSR